VISVVPLLALCGRLRVPSDLVTSVPAETTGRMVREQVGAEGKTVKVGDSICAYFLLFPNKISVPAGVRSGENSQQRLPSSGECSRSAIEIHVGSQSFVKRLFLCYEKE